MKILKIKLPGIEDVRTFVNTVAKYDVDMDLRSGRYVVDAKSLLAIFSLDLMSPIECIIHTEDEAILKDIVNDINKYEI